MRWRYLAHLAFSVLVLCLELGTSTICFHEYPLATFVYPAPATFENVADTVFPLPLLKQSEIHTSPNCIFSQWDTKLQKWDTGSFCHEEILTGGACVGDPNNDRYPDIFFPSIHKNGKLYINDQNGAFLDKSTEYFGYDMNKNKVNRGNACMFFDMNNDGYDDLYISTVGHKRFYFFKNVANGTKYEDASFTAGLENKKNDASQAMTAGFSMDTADVDNDGYLDVVTTEWLPLLNLSPRDIQFGKAPPTNSRFFLNLRNETFLDFTAKANLEPSLHAPKDLYFEKMCDELNKKDLQYLMSKINEPYKKSESSGVTLCSKPACTTLC